MKKDYISEDEFDTLSDYQARNYVYCHDCRHYHLHGFECYCGLAEQLKIIMEDK